MADDCSCECVWTHEMAIRRLLSLIRQSQSHCTDTECIDLPSLPSPTGGEETSFTMMTMFMVLAVILYFIKPDSIMKVYNSKKPNGGRPSGGRDPPSGDAPPAVN
ncbi:small integral membrane protein 14 [Eupeodes corollae]|uniref:small integral membrane protein 14 n=1 Tax=Eupeodes corollae TaxID=290404 RepID=UPI0024908F35|nr:small integral membrane protein 14 [Eupeodes corollae]XP_055919963.1 small integral membrane protein 14 [Eupeodes corollae]XP_055919964.1 small integral membrane protein 14 [Eupeodes corollae]